VSFIVQIGNFILLVILLNIVLYKPIRGILAQRKEKVEGLTSSIQSSESLVRQKEEEFNTGIREARSKGVALKDALVDDASQEEKKILADINEKAQADLAEIREKISKDVESVRAKLQGEIDAFAAAIFEKILGRAL
jgi:F-type H+-transporting ATPase subunit b